MRVSLLTANYNNGKYLDQYFASIIESSVVPDEVIIVDDGSSDDSKAIIEKYARECSFIRPLFLHRNVGFANALNTGLENASGDVISRLDSDDYLHPERIRRQKLLLEGRPDLDIVGTNAIYFDGDGTSADFRSNFPERFEDIRRQYVRGVHGILHGTVMVRSEVYKEYRYSQDDVPAEDFVLFAQMIADGHTAANIKDALTYVRVHAGSVSNELSFKAIELPFLTSNRLFDTHHGPRKIRLFYYHLKYYRRFLFSRNPLLKAWFLLVSASLNPGKIMARLKWQ